jgi:glutamate formiminotransferase
MARIFEIVPNLSEGRDLRTIDEAVIVSERCGAKVLNRTSDPIHHRSVLTIAGTAKAVLDAAVAVAGVAVERINLRSHCGVHPRMGALDVLPFVPLGSAAMDEAVALAHRAGTIIWDRYRVPSFYYGYAARRAERFLLPNVRPRPTGPPDEGELPVHETAGAVAIGARHLLVAFNVDLETGDLGIARSIARSVRERNGGFRSLRALGLALDNDCVQVSLNVTCERATPLYLVVNVVRALAAERGVRVRRCELIGCIPCEAVRSAALYALGVEEGVS